MRLARTARALRRQPAARLDALYPSRPDPALSGGQPPRVVDLRAA
jgi:hypothetical protein